MVYSDAESPHVCYFCSFCYSCHTSPLLIPPTVLWLAWLFFYPHQTYSSVWKITMNQDVSGARPPISSMKISLLVTGEYCTACEKRIKSSAALEGNSGKISLAVSPGLSWLGRLEHWILNIKTVLQTVGVEFERCGCLVSSNSSIEFSHPGEFRIQSFWSLAVALCGRAMINLRSSPLKWKINLEV